MSDIKLIMENWRGYISEGFFTSPADKERSQDAKCSAKNILHPGSQDCTIKDPYNPSMVDKETVKMIYSELLKADKPTADNYAIKWAAIDAGMEPSSELMSFEPIENVGLLNYVMKANVAKQAFMALFSVAKPAATVWKNLMSKKQDKLEDIHTAQGKVDRQGRPLT